MNKKTTLWTLGLLTSVCVLIFLAVALKPPADGWATRDGQTIYHLDGNAVTGWLDVDGSRYYFDEDGVLLTGWQDIDGARYYFDADGSMVTGWLADAHYLYQDGTLATGWLKLDGKEYFLGHDGRRKQGIVEVDGTEYLLNEQGYLSYGWTEIDGKRYYSDENGSPLHGWNEIDGKKYYFSASGAATTGWWEMDGFSYYFYTDGSAAQGELTIDGTLYHFGSNGQMILLVNPWNYLPEDYTVALTSINNNHQIASIGYEDFLDMMTDCRAAGFEPMVCSSYRTQEYQEKLFQNRIDRYVHAGYSEEAATELAGQSVAIPGTSEHQLGLAVDLVDDNNWHLDETQAETPTQQWLMENSWRYGWILRYPIDKSEFTGIIYEPWHYRYVGRSIAKEIHELDVCLEEYLQMLTNSVG